MDDGRKLAARRRALKCGLAALVSLAAAPVTVPRAAAGSSTMTDFGYQDRPKDGKRCAECSAYVAEGSSCKVFREVVSPDGWCMAYSRKE